MADRITLTGLKVFGRHGVFEQERVDGHKFVVDVTVWADLTAASRSDDLTDTFDYGAIAQLAARIVGGESCLLVERLAGKIADELMLDARLVAAEVTVHKPTAPIPLDFADVAVTIRRSRRSAGKAARASE
ncbi:dihydroneopterin aldolase [Tamaricihabitans halophyticus]|uniref:7,8-dihydroneopterin aldolase n=1 Tax=Tamaricihabitans halophyticus TaxID=1262583 RepID=A0A4R2R1Y5_9PSEU|nr:dihydroneopterin aldolase [Tamaricihabitans halophyticus]TCP56730.1 dihydroneopterin aldolase [Tamaricihabitans halophyticus]